MRTSTHGVRLALVTWYNFDLTVFKDEFVVGGEVEEDDLARRAADHARFDRRERELDDQDLAKIAEDVSQRYRRTAVRYSGDMSDIPQRLLMPSVHDANLWQVRVRVCTIIYPACVLLTLV